MFYASFFVAGILEEKQEYGQNPNDTPCLILWVIVEKPFFMGGNLDIDKTAIPITVREEHMPKLGQSLDEGMVVAISGEIRTFQWRGRDGHGNEANYKIIELVAKKVLAVSVSWPNNFLKHSPN